MSRDRFGFGPPPEGGQPFDPGDGDAARFEGLASQPRVSESCLSDLELDEIVAKRAPSVRQDAHLVACERCRARLCSFQAAAAESGLVVDRLLATARGEVPTPRESELPQPRRRSPLVWAAGGAAGAAMAMAALLVVVEAGDFTPGSAEPSGETADVAGPGERSKGAARAEAVAQPGERAPVRMFLRRGTDVRRAHSGDVFHEGDQVRFVVRSPIAKAADRDHVWFLMLGVEASGKLSAYYPFGGERSMRIDGTSEVQLPGSLVLDGSPSDELLLSLFSAEPIDVAAVRERIEARGTPATIERLVDVGIPGARAHWTLLKRPKRPALEGATP